MTPPPRRQLNLDRVALAGFVMHRRSATLHVGSEDPRIPNGSPWWVSLACARIPDRYRVSQVPIRLEARLISGRAIRGEVTIVERHDDAYGTQLLLAGIGPLDDAVR